METKSSLTPEQHALRKKCIGASEVSAILGISPWESAADVYYRKVGDVEPEKATEAMERGIALEPLLIQWAAGKIGIPMTAVRTPCPTVLHGTKPIGATHDALICRGGIPTEGIQAKTSSTPAEFGEEGSDEVPDHITAQVQQEMELIPTLVRVWVPVMFFGYRVETKLYCVNRNEELGHEITSRAEAWWDRHVIARVAPENTPPSVDFLKRLRRQPASTILLGQQAVDLVAEWEKAKDVAKTTEEAADAAKAAVLAMLGIDSPAECGTMPDGREITFMSQRSAPGVNKELLRAKWPEAFEACVSQGFHRVLRVKKGKS